MGVVRGLVTREEVATIPDEEVYTRSLPSEDIVPIVVYLASDRRQISTARFVCQWRPYRLYVLPHKKDDL
jgi:hypothetical protein